MVILSLTTLLLYIVAITVVLRRLLLNKQETAWLYASASAAMLLHAIAIAQSMGHMGAGQDMSLLNVASAVSLLIGVVMTPSAHLL